MQILLHTDHPMEDHVGIEQHLQTVVTESLQRFREQVTRVEAHLDDREGHSKISPDHVRLVLEARIAGLPPISVSDNSATVHQVINSAAHKLARAVESTIGKHTAHRRQPDKADPAILASESEGIPGADGD